MFEELDAEQERKENKRKAAARKRSKRKEKKRKELAEKTETPHSVVSGLSFSSIKWLKLSSVYNTKGCVALDCVIQAVTQPT